MIGYHALYKKEADVGSPVGLIVYDPATNDALLWDHQVKGWTYDRAAAARILFTFENEDRLKPIEREEAERATLIVTKGEEALPDEETIRWLFQWKGAPPQGDA